MKRSEILETASNAITVDRAATHGKAETSFTNIAHLWSWWLDTDVTAHDVAIMMVLFKAARIRGNHAHEDNYVDLAGYCALAGEMAE